MISEKRNYSFGQKSKTFAVGFASLPLHTRSLIKIFDYKSSKIIVKLGAVVLSVLSVSPKANGKPMESLWIPMRDKREDKYLCDDSIILLF